MGIGDWGLGIGPNPQSPIPNPHFYLLLNRYIIYLKYKNLIKIINNLFIYYLLNIYFRISVWKTNITILTYI